MAFPLRPLQHPCEQRSSIEFVFKLLLSLVSSSDQHARSQIVHHNTIYSLRISFKNGHITSLRIVHPLPTRNRLSHHPPRQQRAFTVSATQATLRLPADAGLAYLVPLVWCRFPTRPGRWLSCRRGRDLIPLPGPASLLLRLVGDLRVRLREAGLPSRQSCEVVPQRAGVRGVGGGRVLDCMLACAKWWCREGRISAWAEVVSSKKVRDWGCAGEVFDGCRYGTWEVRVGNKVCLRDGGSSGHDGVRVDV